MKNLVQNGFEKLGNIKSKWNRDNFVDGESVVIFLIDSWDRAGIFWHLHVV